MKYLFSYKIKEFVCLQDKSVDSKFDVSQNDYCHDLICIGSSTDVLFVQTKENYKAIIRTPSG